MRGLFHRPERRNCTAGVSVPGHPRRAPTFCRGKVTAPVAGVSLPSGDGTDKATEGKFPHPELAWKEVLGPSALQEFLPQLPWGAEWEEGGTQGTRSDRLGLDLRNRGRGFLGSTPHRPPVQTLVLTMVCTLCSMGRQEASSHPLKARRPVGPSTSGSLEFSASARNIVGLGGTG